jgi:hypothetical protein
MGARCGLGFHQSSAGAGEILGQPQSNSLYPRRGTLVGVIGKSAKLRLFLWLGLFEGQHRLGVLIEPGHELGMSGTPFAFVPEIEIAEGAGKRKMAVIGAATPSWRAFLELVERAVDLGLLALLPGRVPLLFGAESLLIDQQQRGIEDAGRPMSQGPAFSSVRVRSSGTAPVRASDYRDTRRFAA